MQTGKPMERTSRGCPTHRRCAVESFSERAILNHVQERAAYGGWHLFGRSAEKIHDDFTVSSHAFHTSATLIPP